VTCGSGRSAKLSLTVWLGFWLGHLCDVDHMEPRGLWCRTVLRSVKAVYPGASPGVDADPPTRPTRRPLASSRRNTNETSWNETPRATSVAYANTDHRTTCCSHGWCTRWRRATGTEVMAMGSGRVGGWRGGVARREVSQPLFPGFPLRAASLRDHGRVLRFQPPPHRTVHAVLPHTAHRRRSPAVFGLTRQSRKG